MASSVFQDESVLDSPQNTPKIAGRNDEIRSVILEFMDSPLNVTPGSALIAGWSKSGKSTVLQGVFNALRGREAQAEEYSLNILDIDCGPLESRREVWFEILGRLGHESIDEIPEDKRKYTTFAYLHGEVRRLLADSDYDLVVVGLDDIDTLEDAGEVFEEIIRMDSRRDETIPRVGAVATSTRYGVFDEHYDLKHRFLTKEVGLSYPAESMFRQMVEINAEAAFKNDAIHSDAIDVVQEFTYNISRVGDALQLLKRAGEIADQTQAKKVRATHVEQAVEEHRQRLSVDWLLDRELDVHNQAILLALANENQQPVRAKQLYESYVSIIEAGDSPSFTYRRFRERLKGIILEPFIEHFNEPFIELDKQHTGRKSGVFFEVQMTVDPEVVYTALNHPQYQDLPSHLVPQGRLVLRQSLWGRTTG